MAVMNSTMRYLPRERFEEDARVARALPLDARVAFLKDRIEDLTGVRPQGIFANERALFSGEDYARQEADAKEFTAGYDARKGLTLTSHGGGRSASLEDVVGGAANILLKSSPAAIVVGVLAAATLGCNLPAADSTSTPVPTGVPPMVEPSPTVEPTATPLPVATATPTAVPVPPVEQFFSALGNQSRALFETISLSYDVEQMERSVRFSLDGFVGVISTLYGVDAVVDVENANSEVVFSELVNDVGDSRLSLAPGEYMVVVRPNEAGAVDVLDVGSFSVSEETVTEQETRTRLVFENEFSEVQNTFYDNFRSYFADEAQFGVFEKEFSSLDRRFDASARAEKDLSVVPYESFVKVFTEHVDASLRDAEAHNFPYDVNDAAEEVKRAVIAANVALGSGVGNGIALEDITQMFELYREHRVNNIENFEGRRVAFSDPTNFNSVFDMAVVLNYLGWEENGEERQRMLKNDVDARSVLLARADALGFFAFPDRAFNEESDWVQAADLERFPNAKTPSTPFSSTTSLDPRFSLWPVLDDVDAVRASQRQLGVNNEGHWQLGGERWEYLKQLDIVPTSNALVLDALAEGNLNLTAVKYDFNEIRLPFDNVDVHPAELSVRIIDDSMKHRELVADFDVRSRVFRGNHGSLYNLSYGTAGSKGEFIDEYINQVDTNAAAFRNFGLLKPERIRVDFYPDVTYPGEGVEILPEDVLVQAGGWLVRANVDPHFNDVTRAQYDQESFGIMCLAPGTVSYPNGLALNNVSYLGGQCTTDGEPWPFPLGLQLHEDLSDPALRTANLHWPALPNSSDAPLPMYPFVDVEQTNRIRLNNFVSGGLTFTYGGGNTVGKFYLFNPGLFDEGFSRLPGMRPELLEQFPGIVDAFLKYSVENPKKVYDFFDDVRTYYPESIAAGWQNSEHIEPMRALFRGPWLKAADTVEAIENPKYLIKTP